MANVNLLNKFTQEVLAEAQMVSDMLPGQFGLSVSADSDVVLSLPDGDWVGIRMYGLDQAKRRWVAWRGSLPFDEGSQWPTLGAAVAHFTEGWDR